ncbi:hypothetical protein PR202_gb00616 [Eleusine coracana subsp. coracana]|uniref:Major facilitator superfamily (MFS) profile domain-containing protein n=1 Tax=Eleusine coracana subsp. coracana TaxID=191504 RepID=A0AAV5DTU2_ELECO|nr:hypothetical protein PR202_gb00616 [Eleusine coracana subsp. coracana]
MAGGEGEAAAAPLLEEKPQVYVDGCPGCAVDRRKAENPGIPYKHFFHIWIIILVSCASYMLGRALTSTAWGMVADRIGRKPVIVLAILSTLVFNTLFGLSVHYWMALATRFLLGSLNGLLGPIRAYAVEICRAEHQAIGLSLVGTSWAIGLILGPAIGGYLAQVFMKSASILLYQTFIYPHVVKALGPIKTSRIAAVTAVTCSFILQNNSVPQDQRATANGLATTLMSFGKAFAPAGAGIV